MLEKPVKFYVAAKWQDRPIVRQVFDMLESRGHVVTVDWTNHDLPDEKTMEPVDVERFLSGWAEIDIKGVRDCDYLIALFMEPRHQRGAMIEVGAALGLGKPVWIVGKAEDSSTLLRHPLIMHLADINHLNQWLKNGFKPSLQGVKS